LLNFQTMIVDLTQLDIANASMLDEATAAAEAMTLCHAAVPDRKTFFVADDCHPETIDVVRTRAKPLGIEVKTDNHARFKFDKSIFGALIQYPATDGAIYDYTEFVKQAHDAGALVVVAADILAVIASMYAVYHGPLGLCAIGERVHRLTSQLVDGLRALGLKIANENFFDTIHIEVESSAVTLEHAQKAGCNLRALGPRAVGVSFDETTTERDIEILMSIFRGTRVRDLADDDLGEPPIHIPQSAIRSSQFLTHPVFNAHDTETEMLRYLKKLESRDLSLCHSMIPLGSC